MKYLFEFTGEHKTLPFAELNGVLEGVGVEFESKLDSPGVGIVTTQKSIQKAITRLALLRSTSHLKFICPDPTYDNVTKISRKKLKDLKGTFALDARRILGYHRELSTTQLKKNIGGAIVAQSKDKKRVDMKNPDVVLKILLSNKLYAGKLIAAADRTDFEARHNRHRPFFSPISLHPKFARAMINLARVRKSQSVLDPFCGTGGILLEGASIGLKVYGSDISEKMVNGTRRNLEHFNLDYQDLQRCDIKSCPELFGKMDAVVTDPPYGKSASTSGEGIIKLYKRTFATIQNVLKRRRYLVIMLPAEKFIIMGEDYFKLKEHYAVYVHRSLTRHICVYQN
ncbi:MAG: methyltransferase domain-containing protein [Thermoplasmata archaeon]|nr:MAG: methyltransferase domain-containing protein [Thermoplasmata archaeon]